MTDSKEKKNITFRVPLDTWRAVRAKLATEGDEDKWQPLLLGLIRQWLGGDITPAAATPRSKHAELLDKLTFILDSGCDDAIKAVTENILVFERYSKLKLK